MFKIEKSTCGKFIRITVGKESMVLSIGDFSRKLAGPSEFRHLVELPAPLQIKGSV
jgi:hypothetical protein